MGIKVGEFFVDMVVDAASGNLSVRQLIGAMGELEVKSLGGAYGLTKIAEKIMELARGAMTASTNLLNFKTLTGTDTKWVQSWDAAAEQLGIQSGSIQQSIRRVQDTLAPVAIGAASEPALLRALGIPSYKGVDANNNRIMKSYKELMYEISGSKEFWEMPRATRLMLMSPMFSDADYIIMDDMRKGLFSKRQQAPMLDDKQIAYFRELDALGASIKKTFQSIFTKFLFDGQFLMNYFRDFEYILRTVRESMDTVTGSAAIKSAQSLPYIAGDYIENILKEGPLMGIYRTIMESLPNRLPFSTQTTPSFTKGGDINLNIRLQDKEGRDISKFNLPVTESLNQATKILNQDGH